MIDSTRHEDQHPNNQRLFFWRCHDVISHLAPRGSQLLFDVLPSEDVVDTVVGEVPRTIPGKAERLGSDRIFSGQACRKHTFVVCLEETMHT